MKSAKDLNDSTMQMPDPSFSEAIDLWAMPNAATKADSPVLSCSIRDPPTIVPFESVCVELLVDVGLDAEG